MYKLTVFIGSSRKKGTYLGVQEFEKNLKEYTDFDLEYVFLSKYNLEFCNGCKLCFDKGEELCPLKDDRDLLLEKIENSDGIILASPNYSFSVSARMKNFLDRIAFVFHRPRYFGKICTVLVSQGIFGGGKIQKYLEDMGRNLGFTVTKGCFFSTLEPMTEKQIEKIREKTKRSAFKFYKGLSKKSIPNPSLSRLMMFRMTRESLKTVDTKLRDYYYFKEKGWLSSDYYHDTSMGFFKKAAGHFFDFIGRQLAKNMQ